MSSNIFKYMDMKLYTEEQVRQAFKAGMNACMKHKDWALAINYPNKIELSEYMNNQIPIELPSDEEIENKMHSTDKYHIMKDFYCDGFRDGAKWMRDKIGGNNEQSK